MPKKVRPIPKEYHTVTASLVQEDATRTIEFCKKAFGAKLRMKIDGPGGKVAHAELQIGDSIVMLNDSMQEPAATGHLFLYVESVDKAYTKALKAGATSVMPPQDMFWGDRFARVNDPSGNGWGIATHIEDVDLREMKKRAAKAFSPDVNRGVSPGATSDG
jgi:PhnB protein